MDREKNLLMREAEAIPRAKAAAAAERRPEALSEAAQSLVNAYGVDYQGNSLSVEAARRIVYLIDCGEIPNILIDY